ncbi:fungal-specific transcription factor domain-containing protein [Xylogone sp. PMI_703]|nr:fungal-specific transcription factor domain-containing protein [Xylogone sp. PMI_703]
MDRGVLVGDAADRGYRPLADGGAAAPPLGVSSAGAGANTNANASADIDYIRIAQAPGQAQLPQVGGGATGNGPTPKKKNSRSSRDAAAIKRRCVSTACIACRRRKSKCDGNMPACAACSQVYGTACIYDPNSDHRRKGVYKEKTDNLKMKNSTLQTLIHAILNASEDEVPALVKRIRTCESLDEVAESINRNEKAEMMEEEFFEEDIPEVSVSLPTFETELSGKMGELRLENGSVRFLGGTSNLIYLDPAEEEGMGTGPLELVQEQEEPLTSWTTVTSDPEVIVHLINMYFTWHYPFFTTLSRSLFYRDFLLGKPHRPSKRTMYCSSLLVNAMLALGCHFTNSPQACADPNDPTTKGDHFFAEAKRLIVENDEYERPRLVTVQALCLMSVREAGCGREAKGWVYSGMAFRMAQDMGLNLDSIGMTNISNSKEPIDEKDVDARRITFWGCFLFDKCWSNYLGRLPQLPTSNITVPRYEVFPTEDADIWSPYTDSGISDQNAQVSRTRAVALQISRLCEISSDLLIYFYHPQHLDRSAGKSQELKKLGELQTRLEAWRRELPKELEPKEGQLPNVLLMHMFFHLLYIHLFRPFLKYNPATSPLPSHVSPRKLCTQNAASISKLMRLYKRTYGLRQICNIAVYIVHSACTIHLLNLPEKNSKRDIIHGVKHLEEIAEDWLCARRTLSILSVLARKWNVQLPEEASEVLTRTDARFGYFSTADVPSPKVDLVSSPASGPGASPRAYQQLHAVSEQPRMQTALQQSLYSYSPGASAVAGPRIAQLSNQHAQAVSPPHVPLQPQTNMSPMSLPPETAILSPISYPITTAELQQAQAYITASGVPTNHSSPAHDFAVSEAGSTASLPRQISPSQMLGGMSDDGLAQSQDWWLRDQANLAAGFENWDGRGGTESSGVADEEFSGMSGAAQAYYMNTGNPVPSNGSGSLKRNRRPNEEWYG